MQKRHVYQIPSKLTSSYVSLGKKLQKANETVPSPQHGKTNKKPFACCQNKAPDVRFANETYSAIQNHPFWRSAFQKRPAFLEQHEFIPRVNPGHAFSSFVFLLKRCQFYHDRFLPSPATFIFCLKAHKSITNRPNPFKKKDTSCSSQPPKTAKAPLPVVRQCHGIHRLPGQLVEDVRGLRGGRPSATQTDVVNTRDLLESKAPRTFLTPLLGFKPTKIRSFTVKTRVKKVLGCSYSCFFCWFDPVLKQESFFIGLGLSLGKLCFKS